MKIVRIKLKTFFTSLSVPTRKIFNFIIYLFPKFATCIKVFFLRKTNTFIKSKYSKNRQWSKSIVYFGLWFGVISAFAISYYTYKFLFILSYIWWVPTSLILCILVLQVYKNRKYINSNFLSFWYRNFFN